MGRKKKHKKQRPHAHRGSGKLDAGSGARDEAGHLILPGSPPPGFAEELTKNFQKQIRNSPMWNQMVEQFGEEKAEELLKQCKAEVHE